MKLSVTRHIIDAYAEGIAAADARPFAEALRTIVAFLAEFSSEPMSVLVERGSQDHTTCGAAQPTASATCSAAQTAAQLNHLACILAAGSAKADHIKDVMALSNVLHQFGESETLSAAINRLRDAMKPEPRHEQVDSFIQLLKRETGSSAFETTFARLAQSTLKREDVVNIAKSVYGGIKSNTSRKGALDYIRKPHDAYNSAKKGIDATGGRSAA